MSGPARYGDDANVPPPARSTETPDEEPIEPEEDEVLAGIACAAPLPWDAWAETPTGGNQKP